MTTFKPMRSIAPDDRYPITFPKYASPKLDGIRICKYQGQGRTKSGKPIPNHDIRAWVEKFMPEGLDGEIIVGPPNSEGVYGLTFKAVMSHDAISDFTIYVFDVCDDLVSYTTERLERVNQLAEGIQRLKVVEQTLIHTTEQLDEFYTRTLDLGYEGVILRDPRGQYKYGRSTAKEQTQLKIKPEEDFEALVLSVYEGEHNANEAFTNEVGETKRSTHQCNKVPNGMLGGFHVLADGVEFNVAPGKMTHAERIQAWAERDSLPGRYIKYRSMTYGTMTNGAARHGRWVGWRDTVDMEPK